MEEAGIELKAGHPAGKRLLYRPHDIRVAINDGLKHYGVEKGDVFMVSTQSIRFDVPNLANAKLVAGDDAISASANASALVCVTVTRP